MRENTQYTANKPTGGTGLLGVHPAISVVANFCTDELYQNKCLAPMRGEGVVYAAQWYDESGKPRDCLTASPPLNIDEPPSGVEDTQVAVLPMTPAPTDMAGKVPDDDAEKKASSSESDSSSSSSSSGSGDSSSDSASS